MGWYAYGPYIRQIRKWIDKPADDYAAALLTECFNEDFKEGTREQPRVVDDV